MKRFSRTLAAAIAAAVAGAGLVFAIQVPQTREEFVKAVAGGAGATAVETITSDQPLDRIYAVLQDKVPACLDVTVSRTANVGYVEHSSSDYTPTLRRTGKGTAEFTLQVAHTPRGVGARPPAGGLYYMAADLRAVDASHTAIVLYRPTMGVKKIVASLKDWFNAVPSDCPKLR